VAVRTIQIVTGAIGSAQDEVVVSEGHVLGHRLRISVDVRLGARGVGARGRVVLLDVDVLHVHVEGTAVGSLAAVPVNRATSPLAGALSRSVTTGPETELDTGGGLRERVITGSLVLRVLLIQSTVDLAIDAPLDLVLLPVNSVLVVVLLSVRAHGALLHVAVVLMALPVVVSLSVVHVVTNKLVVDLVLDVGQEDDVADNATSARSLQTNGHLAVPEVVRTGDSGGTGLLEHLNAQSVVISASDVTEVAERVLLGVTQVLGIGGQAVSAVEGVVAVLVDRHGHTRARGVRVTSITAAQTDVTVATGTLGRAARVFLGAGVLASTARRNVVGIYKRHERRKANRFQHHPIFGGLFPE